MAKINFETGSNVTIWGRFRTPKTAIPPSTLIDPSIVELSIRNPDKTVDEYTYGVDEIVKNDVGVYTFELLLAQQGTYHWRWRGINGTAIGLATGTLDSVSEPNF